MTKANKKKTSKEKRALIAALCITAVAVAGSTFAWFTSQDDVTNRLAAKGEYRTAVGEVFTPPEDWTPGQEINKDVTIQNTGNIDALIKVELEGKLSKLNYYTTSNTFDADKAYELDTATGEDAAKDTKAIEAGGKLVKAPAASEKYGTSGTVGTPSVTVPVDITGGDDTFAPDAEGTYIFQRNDNQYSGYYYKDGKYYGLNMLKNNNGAYTYVLANAAGNGALAKNDVAGYADQYVLKETLANAATMTLSAPTTADINSVTKQVVKATYDVDNDDTADITFQIILADDYATYWDYVDGAFFYKDDLAAGKESKKLVDAVIFDETTVVYTDLEFDLDVKLTSVQTVKLDNGTEVLPGQTAKTDGTATAVTELGGTKASTSHTTDTDISAIAWSTKGTT